jgi:hypothetical protein
MAALSADAVRTLAPPSRDLLGRLASRGWADDVYLAGSAALALYIAHRRVRDLDLMAPANRLTGPERRDLLADLLALDPELRVETARDGYLYLRAGSGVALRFFHYPYPQIEPEQEVDGLAVASPIDLGLMKIAAIISRGTKRDFIDLYLLARHLPLEALLDRASDKFGHVRDFRLQALKGLADFALSEGEPMPRLDEPVEWDEVRRWFAGEVRRLGRLAVGLDSRDRREPVDPETR